MQKVLNWQTVRCLSVLLAVLVFSAGITSRVHAGLIPTSDSQITAERAADIDAVRHALENKIVSERLQELGYSADEVDQRLAMLSDEELSKLAQEVDNINSGGSVFGVLVGAAIIVLIVFAILEITGDADNF